MADNLTTPLGSGIVLAADDIAGVLYPRTKLSHGADGVATDVSATNPLPVIADDLVLDHANGVKVSVTSEGVTLITPPAGCRFLQIYPTGIIFIRTDNTAAGDAAGSLPLSVSDIIPVTAGTSVTAYAASPTTVYVIPYKERT